MSAASKLACPECGCGRKRCGCASDVITADYDNIGGGGGRTIWRQIPRVQDDFVGFPCHFYAPGVAVQFDPDTQTWLFTVTAADDTTFYSFRSSGPQLDPATTTWTFQDSYNLATTPAAPTLKCGTRQCVDFFDACDSYTVTFERSLPQAGGGHKGTTETRVVTFDRALEDSDYCLHSTLVYAGQWTDFHPDTGEAIQGSIELFGTYTRPAPTDDPNDETGVFVQWGIGVVGQGIDEVPGVFFFSNEVVRSAGNIPGGQLYTNDGYISRTFRCTCGGGGGPSSSGANSSSEPSSDGSSSSDMSSDDSSSSDDPSSDGEPASSSMSSSSGTDRSSSGGDTTSGTSEASGTGGSSPSGAGSAGGSNSSMPTTSEGGGGSSTTPSSSDDACPCPRAILMICGAIPPIAMVPQPNIDPCAYLRESGTTYAVTYVDSAAGQNVLNVFPNAGGWLIVARRPLADGPIGAYTVDAAASYGPPPCLPPTVTLTCAASSSEPASSGGSPPPSSPGSSAESTATSSGAPASSASSSSMPMTSGAGSVPASSSACELTGDCTAGGNFTTAADLTVTNAVLSTRCQIYRETCIDVGDGPYGSFVTPDGRTFGWQRYENGEAVPASLRDAACGCASANDVYLFVVRTS